jgi:hypothetical protein
MKKPFPWCRYRRCLEMLCVSLVLLVCGLQHSTHAAPGDPVLLSEQTSTRAIALESVTFHKEPFRVTSGIPWSPDQRTRIILFAMNLTLLPGETANAVTAEAQDTAGNKYSLAVEYVGAVPGNVWMSQIVVRLNDQMTDNLGDVLVRVVLRGMTSNRVRVGIGSVGGGPPDDQGSLPTPAPWPAPTPTPSPTPSPTPKASTPDVVRFLEQATWGPTASEVTRVQDMGYQAYLSEQFTLPASSYPTLELMPIDIAVGCPAGSPATCGRDNYTMYPVQLRFFDNALNRPDQLRQRVAFALHSIIVVSGRDLQQPSWMAPYLQILDRNAFGNFRTLLQEITLNPAMGFYLDMATSTRTNPNENYPREILQLFSIGTDQLNLDGTPKLDGSGNRIPTYDQNVVNGFTKVFTGWRISAVAGRAGVLDYINPMTVTVASNHDTTSKQLLDGVTLPANQTSAKDLADALDNIYNHPNVAPFISRQLIQYLVTSNPSPAYVQRVATVFNTYRTDPNQLRYVVEAILLDQEARGDVKTDPNYGHLRSPVLFMTAILRAFNARSADGTTTSDGYLAPNAVTLDMDPLRPPTVFSYYQPDYVIPGTTVLGPEYGILSTSTVLRRANFVNTMAFSRINAGGNAPRGTALDLSAMQTLASNPTNLVNELDRLLLHGTMSASMRTQVTQAVTNIAASNPLLRAQTAIYLVATSSQYQVQR